ACRRGDRMKRREFITLLGGAAAWPLTARAQQAASPRRIGILISTAENDRRRQIDAFRGGLREFGWTEGGNIHIDYRFAGGNPDQFSVLARELIALHPEVIFAHSTPV